MLASVLASVLALAACSATPSAPSASRTASAPAGSTSAPPGSTSAPAGSPSSSPVRSAEPDRTPAAPDGGEPSRPVTLAFGGDVHFEGASAAALRGGLDDVEPVLSEADLAVVNLETAITRGGTPAPKDYVFRAPPSAFDALREAGVDVVTMANNHGMDYGLEGLHDSLRAAREADFPVVGIGLDEDSAFAPHYAEVRGSTIAVIGATQVLDDSLLRAWTAGPDKPGLASAKDEERTVQAVEAARERADTVVVYLHWGQERNACPLDRQRTLARKLVDAGADVVVGGHAHVLLGGGYLGRAYVDYGLGNFVFYAWPGPGAETGVLTLTVRGREVADAEWSPARISGGVSRMLSGSAARQAAAAKERRRGCTGLSERPA